MKFLKRLLVYPIFLLMNIPMAIFYTLEVTCYLLTGVDHAICHAPAELIGETGQALIDWSSK